MILPLYESGFDAYTTPSALLQSGEVNTSSVGKFTNTSFPLANVSFPEAHKWFFGKY